MICPNCQQMTFDLVNHNNRGWRTGCCWARVAGPEEVVEKKGNIPELSPEFNDSIQGSAPDDADQLPPIETEPSLVYPAASSSMSAKASALPQIAKSKPKPTSKSKKAAK